MKAMIGWTLLVLLAFLLMVMGMQGSAGRFAAVVFTPNRLEVEPDEGWGG